MEKEFTKADLKDGMVIETRERGRYLVLGNIDVYGQKNCDNCGQAIDW